MCKVYPRIPEKLKLLPLGKETGSYWKKGDILSSYTFALF